MAKSKYNKEKIIVELTEWISQGKTLRSFCRQDEKPSNALVYGWINESEDYTKRIARARDIGFEEIAEECFEIADQQPERDVEGKMDKGYVSWQKMRIHTRTQLLSKWNPKKYGDKLQHSGDAENPISLTISREDAEF